MTRLTRLTRPVTRASSLLGAALVSLLALACGPEFDPSSEVTTLRVLAVKKDKPYAQPGETVNLQLLWHDPKGDREVQRAFIGGCINPPGDLYYGCFSQFSSQSDAPFGIGDTFSVTLPADIISGRPGTFEPGQPRYGLYMVFFAVCAGRLEVDPNAEARAEAGGTPGLPLLCLDSDGQPLGADDFIVGYTSIYSFENVENRNPTFTVDADDRGSFLVAGKSVVADCVGNACQGAPPMEVDCDAEPERCIAACVDDGEPECPKIEVAPAIERIVERDDVSSTLFGSEVTEQMWVNYYVDRGGISEVRLLNDSTTGWNEKYRAELRAPKDSGKMLLWAVAHDNRGGIEVSRVTLGVR